jgi:hypothetical protein
LFHEILDGAREIPDNACIVLVSNGAKGGKVAVGLKQRSKWPETRNESFAIFHKQLLPKQKERK